MALNCGGWKGQKVSRELTLDPKAFSKALERKRSGIPERVKERPLVDPTEIKSRPRSGQRKAYHASRCYATTHNSTRAVKYKEFQCLAVNKRSKMTIAFQL
ncbi:hypothetical protein NDU88_006842 [Pleurodeles waltl]|uniref:Uncharacterized protein n=1 Tax=Pleurodeles waltl TaxID=8319 RepID=A0AAV7LQC3_PLEWA|nr:hypothetical protein NDU88_006842 [Pleurodeles waltl]